MDILLKENIKFSEAIKRNESRIDNLKKFREAILHGVNKNLISAAYELGREIERNK